METKFAKAFILANLNEIANDVGKTVAGKIIKVKLAKTGEALFSDYFTDEALWETTQGKWSDHGNGNYTLQTQHTTYRFMEITNLPDAVKAPKKGKVVAEEPAPAIPAIEVVDKKRSHKPINYGNGYDKTEFTFNREITEDEFLEFLKENKYRLHEAEGWWDNHHKIEGKGTKWTYTWVLAYTD